MRITCRVVTDGALGPGVCAETTWANKDSPVLVEATERGLDALTMAHEAAHAIRRVGDGLHHKRWHFCGLSPSQLFRFSFRHLTPAERALGAVLLQRLTVRDEAPFDWSPDA